MPNWCNNILEINGGSERDLVAVAAMLSDNDTPFQSIHPVPDGVDAYDWRIENWGTKWDADCFDLCISDDGTMFANFDTGWSPPIGVMTRLAELFPSLSFRLLYEEGGAAFTGCARFEGGGMIADECRDMEDETDWECNEDGEENPNFIPLTDRF